MRLPEIVSDTWFNSKPLALEDLKGKVVLVDFWTYSCVNCLRTLPYLQKWWEKYKEKDFVIIGIHAPEFEFEKDPRNIELAIKELNVGWPVVMDNDHKNWNNFANRYWPAKYMADKNGKIVYTHFGEGGYSETERIIQKLLMEDAKGTLPNIDTDEHTHGNVCFIPTPELYCGYGRGNLSNSEGYYEEKIADYRQPAAIRRDSIALIGKFIAKEEYVESQERGAILLLQFHATEVNLVLKPAKSVATVEVFLNDAPIPEKLRGKDMNEKGEVEIRKPAMYNLLKSNELEEGSLAIGAKDGNFQAYAFTFSGCQE